jgi:hypothetical protein
MISSAWPGLARRLVRIVNVVFITNCTFINSFKGAGIAQWYSAGLRAR